MSTRIKNVQSGLCFLFCFGVAVCMLAGCATVQHNHAVPSVGVEKHSYAPGENILVNFSNGPGNKDDWIAIYNAGAKPGSGVACLCWLYTDGTNATGENGFSTKGVNAGKKRVSDGSVVFDSASDNAESTTVVWPLAEGDYDVYFFCCFDNDVLAGPVKFTIDSGDGK